MALGRSAWSASTGAEKGEEMNNGINPEQLVPLGELDERVQQAEDHEMEEAASNRHYEGGYSNKRRQRNAENAKYNRRAQKRERNQVAPRAEGRVGAPWWKNPAWWIAGAMVYKALRK